MKNSIIWISIIIAAIVGLALWGRPSAENTLGNSYIPKQGSLIAQETSFDFGSISMAAGLVKHNFVIKNTGKEPIIIGKMYTSCMCTEASLITAAKRFGPFGMPGHGTIPRTNAELAPGEEATIEVVFDPAAHGPAGVGRIERSIIVESSGGSPLELGFTVFVTP